MIDDQNNREVDFTVKAFSATKGSKIDLFVYGALLNEHHVELLLNRRVESTPATLHNYMRVTPNGGFCFIVKHNGAKTHGLILKSLTRQELARLDDFEDEGNLYRRRVVVVRTDDTKRRQRCFTYIGSISALQRTFGHQLKFEDRYNLFIEKKIDEIIDEMPTDRPDITRRVLHELMSSEVDHIIESHFEGNYICNYIMIQAFKDARPPSLAKTLEATPELRPFAGNYMRLACQHIVFNQLVDLIRHQFPDAVRVSQQYFRHGLGILLGFLYYNRHRDAINRLFEKHELDRIVEGRSYRDYATLAVEIVDQIYHREAMLDLIDYVESHWYSTPTPIGAELEFSYLGSRAVHAAPGEDKFYDCFYWFRDFDLFRRTWRLGGHVDSHRHITAGQMRHRGFFEYALGRYQIIGDLSRPLFDCPWAMSVTINQAVEFLDIPPHSLHVSMELNGQHSHITAARHEESDLACLLLLGGDLRRDEDGRLREWRIFNNELDTNFSHSLHFSDRKYHFSKPGQDESEASDIMEFKFLRLHADHFDYEKVIIALKAYQLASHGRPISITRKGDQELPEQAFLREWSHNPSPLDSIQISSFLSKLEAGLLEENHTCKLDRKKHNILESIERELNEKNQLIS